MISEGAKQGWTGFSCRQAWVSKMEDHVRMAERALLYQLGFVLHVALPYAAIDAMIEHARGWGPDAFPNRQEIIQTAWNFINDRWATIMCSLRTGLDCACIRIRHRV